jgi:phospholipid/cholesterol/gamma-HCH transport system substrate-binding protein
MAKKTPSKIMIGLFVIVGAVIGVGTIIWVGASNYFEKGIPYVAYFDESVQGLNTDSRVKMRGVDVGRVTDIDVDAGNAMVEVEMIINSKEPLSENICAELKIVGLTGIMFIDLDLAAPGETLNTAPPKAEPSYPVIPSRPSKAKQIISGIDAVIHKVNTIRTETIVNNLESATARLDKALYSIDRLFSDGRMDGFINDADGVLTEARTTLKSIQAEIQDLKLKEASEKAQDVVVRARDIMDDVGKDMGRITKDLKITGENLRNASERLEQLVEKLEADPSELLFPTSPAPRGREVKR